MKTIKIIIERSNDGYYWGYAESDKIPVSGGGDSVETCKKDILDGIETARSIGSFPYPEGSYQITYQLDIQSFFNYYKKIFTNAALERMTGINQKQLQHYASGLKKPRPAQAKKIEDSLHKLGRELLAVEL